MKLNKYIDHTILKADCTTEDINSLCTQAIQYQFASVCVNPYYVSYVKTKLKDSNVKVCTVIGFPLGANTLLTKVFETEQAIKDGADEIDMVINVAALKNNNFQVVLQEIQSIRNVCDKKILKLIIETALLTEQEKMKACQLGLEANVDFIKTSTGFASGGATIDDIKLIKSIVTDKCQIKASGKVSNFEIAKAMIEAGADRIGTSKGVEIVTNLK